MQLLALLIFINFYAVLVCLGIKSTNLTVDLVLFITNLHLSFSWDAFYPSLRISQLDPLLWRTDFLRVIVEWLQRQFGLLWGDVPQVYLQLFQFVLHTFGVEFFAPPVQDHFARGFPGFIFNGFVNFRFNVCNVISFHTLISFIHYVCVLLILTSLNKST